MSIIHVRFALAALVVLPALGCVAASDPGAEPTISAEQSVTTRLPFPPPSPLYCPAGPSQPVCSEHAMALPTSYDAELISLGCSNPFVIDSPAPWQGMMFVGSITAALCPDNATTRSTVNLHPDQMLAIGYCTPCAPQAPAGQVYVFLHSPHGNSGPGCPSGCGRTH